MHKLLYFLARISLKTTVLAIKTKFGLCRLYIPKEHSFYDYIQSWNLLCLPCRNHYGLYIYLLSVTLELYSK